MNYPEYGSGPYNKMPPCAHQWQVFSDGVYCRKCYKPYGTDSEGLRIKRMIEAAMEEHERKHHEGDM